MNLKKHYTNMSVIDFKKENGIATIALNRPDVFNSFNREMALAVIDALDDVAADDSVRCLVLNGNGKAFCA
jgi:2-(1,2-epoxy-1,2-dihydrophenyl)acetyl-CoA isomerase